MSYIEVEYPAEKKEFYLMLKEQLRLYMGEETDLTARLANASAVIKQAFPEANWTGFYLVDQDEAEQKTGAKRPLDERQLVLGPFQGKPAVSRIGYGMGVCGTAWKENKSQVVEEVSCFPGHIACDCNTHSELVIPLKKKEDDSIWGVLDMDSVLPGYFTEEDREGLEDAVKVIEPKPSV